MTTISDVADKRPLDMPEMLSIVQQLLVAGKRDHYQAAHRDSSFTRRESPTSGSS